MPDSRSSTTLRCHTKIVIKHAEICAVALLLLLGSCSGPRVGGFVERAAFAADVRRATGLTFVRSIRTGTPSADGGARPSGVLVLPSEEIVVVDEDRGRAARFTLGGRFLAYLEAPGAFRASGAALGPGLSVYLLDSIGSTVYRFDSTGQVAGKSHVSTPGTQLSALCFGKAGLAYMSDQDADEIVVIDMGVETEDRFGGFGTGRGMFIDPAGLAVDEKNRLYVCDSGNARVQMLDRWGGVLNVWPLKGDGCTARPKAVAVDRWGNMFITDEGCDCLRVIDATGVETVRLEGKGPGLGFVESPGGLDVYGESLFVADPVEGVIQVFGIVYES